MKKRKIIIFLKYFIVFYALFFLIINWNNFSWIFNRRAVHGLLFDPYQPIEENIINEEYFDIENSLQIPKIEIITPIVISETKDIDELDKKLDDGAVLFPGSVLPGQNGQTIILGHSAPLNWPKIKHDWIFSDLNSLEENDEIIVFFKNKKYIYKVINKIFLEKGEEIPQTNLENYNNILVLVSCWPPGKNVQRIAVIAELLK